ncbi:MAG: hypothetical protein KDA41_08525 [Planctomycetales bacterium]|nr:hypothetical protein [Planctomycetales bacterium]
MAKRDRYEEDENDFLDEGKDAWDEVDDLDEEDDEDRADDNGEADEDAGDADEDAADDSDSQEVAESDPEAEPEPDYPPDDEKAVAALKKLRVRLDVNAKGNVWRAIFDDYNGKDPNLVLLNGLPALKELWLIGTKVTEKAVDEIRHERPKATIYF